MNKDNFSDYCIHIVVWFSIMVMLVGCIVLEPMKPKQVSSPLESTTIPERACPQFRTNIQERYATSDPIKISTEKLSGLVVYSSIVDDSEQLFLKNLDTGDIARLTNSGDNFGAKWSPDGTQIIYISHTKERLNDIYMMSKDGSNQRALITTNYDEDGISWLPDGTKLAFVSNQTGRSQIYIMDIKSKSITQVTEMVSYATLPAWSFDGKRISFQSGDGGKAGRTQIFMMNANGSNLTQITNYDVNTFNGKSVWCPDDSCLVFLRDTGAGAKLMRLDLPGKTITPLFANTFGAETMQTALDYSPLRCFLTFIVDREYFAFDMYNKDLYPLGIVDATSLSLYP